MLAYIWIPCQYASVTTAIHLYSLAMLVRHFGSNESCQLAGILSCASVCSWDVQQGRKTRLLRMEGRSRATRKAAKHWLIDCRWWGFLQSLRSPWGSKTVCSMWKGWLPRLQFLVQSTIRWLRRHAVRRMQQKLAGGDGTKTGHLVVHYLSSSEMINGWRHLLLSIVFSKLLKCTSDIV